MVRRNRLGLSRWPRANRHGCRRDELPGAVALALVAWVLAALLMVAG